MPKVQLLLNTIGNFYNTYFSLKMFHFEAYLVCLQCKSYPFTSEFLSTVSKCFKSYSSREHLNYLTGPLTCSALIGYILGLLVTWNALWFCSLSCKNQVPLVFWIAVRFLKVSCLSLEALFSLAPWQLYTVVVIFALLMRRFGQKKKRKM